MRALLLLYFFFVSFLVTIDQSKAQTPAPGDPVPNTSNLYFGTYSYRDVNGTVTQTLQPGVYNGAPTGAQTNFDSSPFKDYYYKPNGDTYPINMRFIFPTGYQASPVEKYPLIVMLHGLGEGGIRDQGDKPKFNNWETTDPKFLNNDHQMTHGGDIHRRAVQGLDKWGREFPGFVLYPQHYNNGTNGWNNFTQRARTISAIEELLKSYPIDPNRIYIHGLSNGGNGTWKMVEDRPDLFAAYLPMSAAQSNNPDHFNHAKIAHIPIWLFQGLSDSSPTPGAGRANIKALEDAGGNPRYYEYDMGHNTWDSAYIEPDFFSWMLDKSKLSIHAQNGRTHFCEGESFSLKLEITSGFAEYEWSKDEKVIANSNVPFITVDTYGSYTVRFRRNTAWSTSWTKPSDPIEVGIQDPTPTPTIIASGSTTLPSLDGAEEVVLSVPGKGVTYNWNTSSTNSSITVNQAGSYYVSVTEKNGCPSDFSDYVYITVDGPVNITAPSQFAANSVSESVINLFWKDNSLNEKGFEIYRATDPDGSYVFVTKTGENEVFYADRGLDPDTEYYYQMRAVNNTGSSPYTGQINEKTDLDTENPGAPLNLTASVNYDLTSISLKWKPAKDNDAIASYNVYQLNSSGEYVLKGSSPSTNYEVSELTKDNSYTFMVKALDKAGNESVPSNQATEHTAFCGAIYEFYYGSIYDGVGQLGKPRELRDEGLANNFNLSTLNQQNGVEKYFGYIFRSYITITTAGNYTFYVNSDEGSKLFIGGEEIVNNDGRKSGAQEASGTKALSPGIYPIRVDYIEGSGNNYVLEVKYSNDKGLAKQLIPDDVLCSSSSFTAPEAPVMPTNLSLKSISETQINLNWSDSNTEKSGFEIYRSESPEGPFAIIATTAPGATSYPDTNLEQNTTYYYTIRTISNVGASELYHYYAQTLEYGYHEGRWTELPDFSTLTPKKSGTINNFNIASGIRDRNDFFGFEFNGLLNIVTPGFYTFYNTSDDGSKLYIDDQEIVDHDGTHGPTEKSGTKLLSSGFHKIRAEYFEFDGGERLEVRYSGPGIEKQLIPNAMVGIGVVSETTSSDTEKPEPPANPWRLTEITKSESSIGIEWEAATDNVKVTGYVIYNDNDNDNGTPPKVLTEVDNKGRTVDPNSDDPVDGDTNSSSINNEGSSTVNSTMSLLSTEAENATVSTLIRGLHPGTTYNLSIRARDAAGNFSIFSEELPVTTLENQPLPVELKEFYATVNKGFVRLNWVTASETNNDYFTIERSLDGKSFKEIGTVDGIGDSNIDRNYNFDDYIPAPGLLYYRLKQTDTNGVFDYSRIVSIHYNNVASEFKVNIYPNPVNTPEIYLQLYSSNEESEVNVRITDILGKVHMNKNFSAQDVLKKLAISRSALSSGIYIFSVQQSDRIIKKKVIIE